MLRLWWRLRRRRRRKWGRWWAASAVQVQGWQYVEPSEGLELGMREVDEQDGSEQAYGHILCGGRYTRHAAGLPPGGAVRGSNECSDGSACALEGDDHLVSASARVLRASSGRGAGAGADLGP